MTEMRTNIVLAHILTQLVFGCYPVVVSTQNSSTTLQLQTLMNNASNFAAHKKKGGFVVAPIPFEERMRSKFQYYSSHDDITVTSTKSNYPPNKRSHFRIASNETSYPNETSYYPLRFNFETSNLDRLRNGSTERETLIDFIVYSVLPRASNVWSSVLSVIPLKTSIPIKKNTCFKEINIPREYIEQGIENTDLAIFVTGGDCLQKDRLASASPCKLDKINDRPVVGSIYFCLNAFELDHALTLQDELTKFTEITVHELGHILGMNSDLFPFFRDPKTGNPLTPRPLVQKEVTCINGKVKKITAPASNTLKEVITNSGRYFEIVTPTVATITRNQFNCHDLTGARLENQPTSFHECYGSHWDERLFFTEIMSAVRNSATNILSPLTLALLEDSGWYKVKYKNAKISPFGYGAGCEFVNERCIVNGEVPKHSKGFFCNTKTVTDENGDLISPPTCDPTHSTVSACDLTDLSDEDDQIDKNYFNGQALGPQHFKHADFCPMAIISIQNCRDMSGKIPFKGITYGTNSKCFNFKVSNGHRDVPLAYCLETVCDQESKLLNIIIGENRISCDFDGQIHKYPYYSGFTFECPRLASVCPHFTCPANCSGRGICDVSSKKSRCVCFDENDNTPGCYGSTMDVADDKDDIQIGINNDISINTTTPEHESSEQTMIPTTIDEDFTLLGINDISRTTDEKNIRGSTQNHEDESELNDGGKYFFYAALAFGLIILMKMSKRRCSKNNKDLSSSKATDQSSIRVKRSSAASQRFNRDDLSILPLSASITSQNLKSSGNHDKPSSLRSSTHLSSSITSQNLKSTGNHDKPSSLRSSRSSRHLSSSLTSQNLKSTGNHDKPSSLKSALNNNNMKEKKKRKSSKHSTTKHKRLSSKSATNQKKKKRSSSKQMQYKRVSSENNDTNEDVSDLSCTDDDLSN